MGNAFTLICGGDDYLVAREGAVRWAKLCADVADEYSREIVDADAGTVSDVEKAVASFTAAAMTMPNRTPRCAEALLRRLLFAAAPVMRQPPAAARRYRRRVRSTTLRE